jgi:hypothetical protein
MQPYGIAKDLLIEFQDSLTLVDFMVLGKNFLKSVRATTNKIKGIIYMKVDRVHEKFIYHPKNLVCCCQIRVHQFMDSRRVRCVEVLPKHMKSHPQS